VLRWGDEHPAPRGGLETDAPEVTRYTKAEAAFTKTDAAYLKARGELFEFVNGVDPELAGDTVRLEYRELEGRFQELEEARDRTMREMVAGAIFFGSLGCWLFFIVLGNYGLSLQLAGTLDVVGLVEDQGAFVAIFAILETLPLTWLVLLAFTVLAVLFTATSFDSISYILASVVQNDVSEEPMAWNRLFWAFALTFLPTVLLIVGGLETLQTAAIVGGVPLLVITVMLSVSTLRVAQLDLRQQADYVEPIINIESLPEIDPWSPEGKALSRFEAAKEAAIAAASEEQEALDSLLLFKETLRRRHGHTASLSETDAQRLEELEGAYDDAATRKLKTTRDARQTRLELDRQLAASRND
jgi:BCCT family betaine/carnitine transporter